MAPIPKWFADLRHVREAWRAEGGIYRHIALSSLLLTASVVAAAGVVVFGALHAALRQAAESGLETDIRLMRQSFEAPLNLAARHLAAQAESRDLANALADSVNPAERLASRLGSDLRRLPFAVLAIHNPAGGIAASTAASTAALAAMPDAARVLREGHPQAGILVDASGKRTLWLSYPLAAGQNAVPVGLLTGTIRLDDLLTDALPADRHTLMEFASAGQPWPVRTGYLLRTWTPALAAPMNTLGLQVRVGRSDAVAAAAIRQAAAVYAVLAFPILLAGWYAAHRIGRRVTVPIEALSRTASEIARSGSFDIKAEVGNNTEFALLASSFNAMLERLRTTYTQSQAGRSELKELLDNSPDLIARFDRNLRCIYINRMVQPYFDVPPAQVIRRTADEIGICKSAQATIRRIFEEGAEQIHEYDDKGRHFETHCAPEHMDDGSVASVLCIMRDVTARRAAEESLHLAKQAIESSDSAIVVTTGARDGYLIKYVNPAFERVTGYTSGEVVGRNCRFLQGEDRSQPALEQVRAALEQQQEVRVVLRNYRKNGSLFWNELTISPVRDGAGEATHFVGEITDITATHEQQEQLRHRATHDPLTGLPNRNLLIDRLMQAISYAQRYQRMVVVAFLDLDRFKQINDTMGHDAGDQLLRIVADRLSACVRDSDTVARLGGDEFVLVLYDQANEDITYHAMQRVLTSIAMPMEICGREMTITCSIGFAVYPQDGGDAETLIKNADTAMYRAKELGRNNFQFYTEELHTRINERLSIEAGLRRALEQNEFELHYQPRVDLSSGKVTALEALIRWNHPSLGRVEPRRFIPLAEELGMIHGIGEWVLRQACRQQAAWQREGVADLPVAVNISAAQFLEKDFAKTVQCILRETPLAADRLTLEIAESLSMRDPETSIGVMGELKKLGVRLAIDDFGTGYSNLNYLKRLPVDMIKLDESFVQDIASKPEDLAISDAVIAMAHSLHLKVAAEGVETAAQLALLADHGCDEMQGYYFSAPLAVEDCTALLRDKRTLPLEQLGRRRSNRTLLLVDDEPNVLSALERALRRTGCKILTAGSALEAFDLLATHEVGVIVSDQRMPRMTGVEFFARIRNMYPGTVRMILSGYSDINAVTSAINVGAVYKFLNKPWDANELCAIVDDAFAKYEDELRGLKRAEERRIS